MSVSRILFDQAAHDMRNKGNNALLDVAIERLTAFWPRAECAIITVAPHLTRLYYSGSTPVDPESLQPFRGRFDPLHRLTPRVVRRLLLEARETMWHRQSARVQREATATSGGEAAEVSQLAPEAHVSRAIDGFDLYVASGGGYMCDSDKPRLMAVFDRLAAARAAGRAAVMVGQGVGPLEDAELCARAREVLPHVDLICVRERRVALPLLESLGVARERILMTGDDAVEPAFRARRSQLGSDLGISLRLSSYTGVHEQHVARLRSVLHDAASARRAALVAVPISSAHFESDVSRIRALTDGYPRVVVDWRKLETPARAIRRAGRCRVMVSGTYHGAIFALGQGIPVVAVASSREYVNKFAGLSDEFGEACQLVALDEPGLEQALARAIEQAWTSAERWRDGVLQTIEQQITWQRAAYARVRDLTEVSLSRSRRAEGT